MQSIERVATLLGYFGEDPDHGVSELARRAGLSVSTTHRLLAAMASSGLLATDGTGTYRLGPLVRRLALGTVTVSLKELALPVMSRLRNHVSETVGLHVLLASGERAVVAQAASEQALRRHYTEMGVPLPLTAGAPGKAMLAFLPDERREPLLSGRLPRFTPQTITDRRILRQELDAIWKCGVSMSCSERNSGIHTIATPIFDHLSSVVGALSVSAPEQRMDRQRMQTIAGPTRDAGWVISRLMGAKVTPYALHGI